MFTRLKCQGSCKFGEMATFDLDPLFLKGLRLLHSKAKDSADQLRQLLEDVLNQKHHSSSNPASIVLLGRGLASVVKQETDSKGNNSKKNSPKHSNESSSHSNKSNISDEPKKRDTEKRHFEKLKQELTELCGDVKRTKPAESSHSSLSSSPSPQPVLKIEEFSSSVVSNLVTKSEIVESSSLISNATGGSADAEDFAMEMGLACVVCRQLDVTPRNRMIECQECHSLYHQECHRPPVTDNEVNDPRHVWYCIRCTKNMRKISKSHKGAKTNTSPPVSVRESFSKALKTADNPVPVAPSLLPFKRSEIKASAVPQGSGSTVHSSSNLLAATNKPTGLASLAANFNSRATTAAASSTGSASSSSSSKSGFGKNSLSSLASAKSSSTSSFQSHFSAALPVPKTAKPFVGMSGLASLASAAAVVAKSSAGSPRSTSSSTSSAAATAATGNGGNGGKSSSSSLMSADKRLQIMKKKAAAKMQEKRRLSSK